VQSSKKLLAVQIDAAINPGNSGGPVIKDGKLVGIAMQGIVESQNIGYMIPVPVISHFFEDLEDTRYNGFPSLGIEIENTENETLRDLLKIKERDGGVIISHVAPNSPAKDYLQAQDIVLNIDGVPIGVDGTVEFREHERLSLSYLISDRQEGENLSVVFVRNGRENTVDIKLTPFKFLVPPLRSFDKPTYYIYGGLVFTILSADFLQSWGKNWWQQAPIDFLDYLMGTGRFNQENLEEIVVLLQVLPDQVNIGYHEYQNMIVDKVNGKDIHSFKELVTVLQNQDKPHTIIETEQNRTIYLDNTNIESINASILERNNIPFQYSADVAEWIRGE
jgi:hypothetical protein